MKQNRIQIIQEGEFNQADIEGAFQWLAGQMAAADVADAEYLNFARILPSGVRVEVNMFGTPEPENVLQEPMG